MDRLQTIRSQVEIKRKKEFRRIYILKCRHSLSVTNALKPTVLTPFKDKD